MYLKLNNGVPEPYSLEQLRNDNKRTSFPSHPSSELLASYDVYPYTMQAQPDVDWLTSTLNGGPFEQDATGAWVKSFIVEQLPIADASSNVRNYRDTLLTQSDWMALSDTPSMSPAMATYRQALRDVTAQKGFPFAVVWPVK